MRSIGGPFSFEGKAYGLALWVHIVWGDPCGTRAKQIEGILLFYAGHMHKEGQRAHGGACCAAPTKTHTFLTHTPVGNPCESLPEVKAGHLTDPCLTWHTLLHTQCGVATAAAQEGGLMQFGESERNVCSTAHSCSPPPHSLHSPASAGRLPDRQGRGV